MLMGPIFRAELLRTARRGRYYILRFVYGTILLLLFWSGYEGTFAGGRRRRSRPWRGSPRRRFSPSRSCSS